MDLRAEDVATDFTALVGLYADGRDSPYPELCRPIPADSVARPLGFGIPESYAEYADGRGFGMPEPVCPYIDLLRASIAGDSDGDESEENGVRDGGIRKSRCHVLVSGRRRRGRDVRRQQITPDNMHDSAPA